MDDLTRVKSHQKEVFTLFESENSLFNILSHHYLIVVITITCYAKFTRIIYSNLNWKESHNIIKLYSRFNCTTASVSCVQADHCTGG